MPSRSRRRNKLSAERIFFVEQEGKNERKYNGGEKGPAVYTEIAPSFPILMFREN